MKRAAFFALSLVLALAIALPAAPVMAQTPAATWSSAIVYANPTDYTDCTLEVSYITSGSSGASPATTSATIAVAAHGSGELMIGQVNNMPADFTGSAVVSSNCPLSAVYRQFPANGTDPAYSPVLYEAFTGDQAGKNFFIPTFMRSASQFSQVGIQNISDFAVLASVTFNSSALPAPVPTTLVVPAKGSLVFTSADFPGLPATFDGSLTISAVENVTTSPRDGQIVVTAQELQTSGRRAYAFVGAKEGAAAVYIPLALCNYGATKLTSNFAIQNAGPNPARVYIDYRTSEGALITKQTVGIALSGYKLNTNPCKVSKMVGKAGQAIVYSKEIISGVTQSTSAPLVVVGKLSTTDGLSTAFTGQSAGSTALTLPYIRWGAAEIDRSYITITNVSNSTANVTAKYYDKVGGAPIRIQTLTVPANGRRTINPSTFAISLPNGIYAGAVEITSDVPVIALVRNIKTTKVSGYKTLGEDYTGMAILQP